MMKYQMRGLTLSLAKGDLLLYILLDTILPWESRPSSGEGTERATSARREEALP